MATTIPVDMGETRISRSSGEKLVAFGLGACVGVCLYDPLTSVAGMVHIVLPQTLAPSRAGIPNAEVSSLPGKSADTAVPHLIQELEKQGAKLPRLRAAIAGGARIFKSPIIKAGETSSSLGPVSRLEIGLRNIEAVRVLLSQFEIPIFAENVGGTCGRTVTLLPGVGHVFVRIIGKEDKLLVNLGMATASEPLAGSGIKRYGT